MKIVPCTLGIVLCGVFQFSLCRSAERENEAATREAALRGKAPGDVRDDNGLKLKLVWCPAGAFKMGEVKGPNQTPVEVTLTEGFWLGKYEVTQAEWKEVMGTEPWEPWKAKGGFTEAGERFPATYVNWAQTMEFCTKLTDSERKAGRLPDDWRYTLPTEAQWEYACRAGTDTIYSFGDDASDLGDYGWFLRNSYNVGERYAHEVGQKKPNSWGLYDMHGNLEEWCRDWYNEKLPGGRDAEVTPEKADRKTNRLRVMRGGSFQSNAPGCGNRNKGVHSNLGPHVGFRVALCTGR